MVNTNLDVLDVKIGILHLVLIYHTYVTNHHKKEKYKVLPLMYKIKNGEYARVTRAVPSV